MTNKLLEVNSDDDSIEITISKKKKYPNRHIFYFKGVGTINHREPSSMDALHVISQFNKQELFLLDIVNSNLDRDTLQVRVIKNKYPLKEQRILTKAISLWAKKDLMIRIQKQKYMVNPFFIIPTKDKHQLLYDAWQYLH